MTSLYLRPWLFGVPTFLVAAIFLLWSLARLASWIFATKGLTDLRP